jgi:hypothetical protein
MMQRKGDQSVLDSEFLAEFKRLTELKWKDTAIDPYAYGFQIQPGTRWLPGLSIEEIARYEQTLGIAFPNDLRIFLQAVNGTDLPALNVYGSQPAQQRAELFGIYSYPRDLDAIQQKIADIKADREEITAKLAEQGFTLPPTAGLVPIYFPRYVLCDSSPMSSVVLSIYGVDAIVYADSLREYLVKDFLGEM